MTVSIEVLRQFSIFAGFSDEEMAKMAALCRPESYAEGETFAVEGEPADKLRLVLEGKISLEKRVQLGRSGSARRATVSILGQNSIMGWSSVIPPFIFTSSGVCLEPCQMLAIDGEEMRQFIAEHPVSGLVFMEAIAATISERLRNSTTTLTYFLSIISHELKSPLAAVENYLQVMLGGFAGDLTEKQRRMLERSVLRVIDLRGLISDILDLARMRPEQIRADFQWLDPAVPGIQAVEDVQLAASQKHVTLVVERPDEFKPLVAAQRRFRQLFSNLLSNAVKFSPEGGTVTLRVWDEPDCLVAEIMDEGPGIPADEQPLIFEDFFRGRDVGQVAGSGLGLSIAQKIIEAHHGEIRVESPYLEGKSGTKFTVVIPRNLATPDMNRRAWAARQEEEA